MLIVGLDELREEVAEQRRNSTLDILEMANTAYEDISERMRGLFGAELIDEMALYPGDKTPDLLRRIVMEDGYQIFNAASDRVTTFPIKSAYDVHYWFVSTPHPYRLEIMNLIDGFSPLHSLYDSLQAAAGREAGIFGVHASFKCLDEEIYAKANSTLQRNDWRLAMQCESTYGRFAYYQHAEVRGWFLKPRLNLRDSNED